MIKVRNINKTFKDKRVLKNVSVDFYPGKTNLIIGQSGSGKTVLMKCLVGLFDVDEGSIFFEDEDFANAPYNLKKELRKNVGMLFQGGALFDSMTIEENVMFPLTMFTSDSYEKKLERVNLCLSRVNLIDTNDLFPSELSGGMQKRAAIARAISMKPKYLFCDEPNSGLDPKTAVVIDKLIKEITVEDNMTTIINTHDLNSMIEIGDQITFIHEGEVDWQGTKDTILDSDNDNLNSLVYATTMLKKFRNKSQN